MTTTRKQLKHATPDHNLAVTRPDVAAWYAPANPVPATDVFPGGSRVCRWQCPVSPDHAWDAPVKSLTMHTEPHCPFCSNKRLSVTNRLDTQATAIAAEWHPTLNGDRTPADFVTGSGHRAWWLCPNGHAYQLSIQKRTKGTGGCDDCRIWESCITKNAPHLVVEWDTAANGADTPENTGARSTKRMWWRCPAGHRWQATPDNRVRGNTGCPDCRKRRATPEYNLATEHPQVAAGYHPTLNTVPVTDVHPGSETPRYWVCTENPMHVWAARPMARTQLGTGCPVCNHNGWTVAAVRATVLAMIGDGSVDALDATERALLFHTLGLFDAKDTDVSEQLTAVVENAITLTDVYVALGGSTEEVERVAELRSAWAAPDQPTATDDDAGAGDESGVKAAFAVDHTGPFDTDPGVAAAAILEPLASHTVQAATRDGQLLDTLIATRVDKLWRHVAALPTAQERDRFVAAAGAHTGDGALRGQVAALFTDEYADVAALELPAPWASTKIPNLMQKLTAHRVATRRRVANWSGTGAGKTLSALLSATVIAADTVVVFCPNTVIDSWRSELADVYPDAQIVAKTLTPTFPAPPAGQAPLRFLLLNFEQLQQQASRARVEHLLATYPPAFVIIDELHNVKQRAGAGTVSKRKELIGELLTSAAAVRPDLAILAMTATPVLNDLHEARSLVELVTGQELPEVGTRATVANAYSVYAALAKVGLRLSGKREPYRIVEVPVDATDVLDDVYALGPMASVLEVDRALTEARLPAILDAIDGPTLVYTHYVDGIVPLLVTRIRAAGYTVGEFTGENKTGLEQFLAGDVQVLVASAPISTGVNGLQKVSNNLVVNCPPWTAAQTEQLIGRLARQGQVNGEVTVTFPVAQADLGGEMWSWDANRLARIRFKQQLADAAVDGAVAPEHDVDAGQVLGRLTGRLAQLKEQAFRIVHPPIGSTLVPQTHDRGTLVGPVREYSEFSRMNAQLNRAHSTTTAARLGREPGWFFRYHAAYDAKALAWRELPVRAAADLLSGVPGLVVGDFGCGPVARLADALDGVSTVHSFDHVAADPRVIAGDMVSTPLPDGALDVAVFSLSLMGANCADYLREAHRVLREGGELLVWEATSRIKSTGALTAQLGLLGFDDVVVESAGKFTHVRATRADRAPASWLRLSLGAAA